jgi:hypothetical protein
VASIDGIRRIAVSNGAGTRARADAAREGKTMPSGNALVIVEPAARVAPPSITARGRSAQFLAHLIAMDQQAPQTRTRRRAEPAQASLAYRTALGLGAEVYSHRLSKAC